MIFFKISFFLFYVYIAMTMLRYLLYLQFYQSVYQKIGRQFGKNYFSHLNYIVFFCDRQLFNYFFIKVVKFGKLLFFSL